MNTIAYAIIALALTNAITFGVMRHAQNKAAAAVAVCNTEKLESDLAAANQTNDALAKNQRELQAQNEQFSAAASAAQQQQKAVDAQRNELALKLAELNHAQSQIPSCAAWLAAPVGCDIGLPKH